MAEVNRVMEQINRQCERAQIIMGAAIDERFQDKLALTIVAVRGGSSATPAAVQEQPEPVAINHPAEELDTQLLNNRNTTTRPGSRFVPPPPATTPEKMRQLAGRASGRGRKRASGASQGQLPLEIISKGRFDKSEPTIHKGEDLDVPTYIRRGIALN
jgi:cell division protein FtsZ